MSLPPSLHPPTSSDTGQDREVQAGRGREVQAGRAMEEDFRRTPSPPPLHPTSTLPPSISSGWVYVTIQSLLFGLVAMTTVRFKYLWVPYMCVVAGGGVSHCRTWKALSGRLGLPEWKVRDGVMRSGEDSAVRQHVSRIPIGSHHTKQYCAANYGIDIYMYQGLVQNAV